MSSGRWPNEGSAAWTGERKETEKSEQQRFKEALDAASDSPAPPWYRPSEATCSHGVLHGLASRFNDSEMSDVTIQCGDRTWPAHRFVIAHQCQFFASHLSGRWGESNTHLITLPEEDDPNLVHLFLKSLYTSVVDPSEHALVDMLGVHGLAQKYNAQVIIEAVAHAAESALYDLKYNTKELCDAARTLWEMSASSRDPLRIRFVNLFIRDEAYLTQEPFLDLIRTIPEFAVDFHRASLVVSQRQKADISRLKEEADWLSKMTGWDSDDSEDSGDNPRKRRRRSSALGMVVPAPVGWAGD